MALVVAGVSYKALVEGGRGKGPTWMFDLDYLIDSMNYQPVKLKNQANKTARPKEANHSVGTQDNIDTEAKNGGEKPKKDTGLKSNEKPVDQEEQVYLEELKRLKRQEKEANDAAKTLRKTFAQSTKDLLLQAGAARASSTNYVNTASTPVNAASTPLNTACTQTNQYDSQIPSLEDIYEVSRDGIFISASYDDEGAVVDFINLEITMNKAIRTKWVYKNKKDERGVVVRNKVRLVAQGHRQEEGIDYDEIDVKSAFLYGKINEDVYVSQPLGFIDPKFPNKVYKVVKALYGLHQAPRAWFQMSSMGELTFFFGLQVKQKEDDIFKSHDKYVAEILKKFDFLSTASTPIKTKKPLVKDEEVADVDVHLYRSMIGSLMYLTTSRPNIMYEVCACSRFQVTLKTSHLQAVKRIFRHHFIRDTYEKELIHVLKIHTDDNEADLLTKVIDVSRLGKKMQFGLVLGTLNVN
uniref:Reverse transcriptase Ty1/copia-type domain-containing protein n=1 Tax=Tanacetum cinerariifolium TaxID=118510 RepID=A0A6L2KTF0_TANCI|nr:hypothetical protein [Tanacetum cinerariifolium]